MTRRLERPDDDNAQCPLIVSLSGAGSLARLAQRPPTIKPQRPFNFGVIAPPRLIDPGPLGCQSLARSPPPMCRGLLREYWLTGTMDEALELPKPATDAAVRVRTEKVAAPVYAEHGFSETLRGPARTLRIGRRRGVPAEAGPRRPIRPASP
jgi:hypothetical protein